MNALTKSLVVLLPMAMLWGCSTTGTKDTDVTDGGGVSMVEDAGGDSGVMVGSIGDDSSISGEAMDSGMDDMKGAAALLDKRTVYFDFDRSNIKPDAKGIIDAHARHLAANPGARVTLQGHADERGTREYNLALGERRAKAVEKMMTLLGVSGAQITVVSYGEERPAAMGHDEGSWSLNRRVELIY